MRYRKELAYELQRSLSNRTYQTLVARQKCHHTVCNSHLSGAKKTITSLKPEQVSTACFREMFVRWIKLLST
jgi:hypothetical protein